MAAKSSAPTSTEPQALVFVLACKNGFPEGGLDLHQATLFRCFFPACEGLCSNMLF